jgi:hypothetical protein
MYIWAAWLWQRSEVVGGGSAAGRRMQPRERRCCCRCPPEDDRWMLCYGSVFDDGHPDGWEGMGDGMDNAKGYRAGCCSKSGLRARSGMWGSLAYHTGFSASIESWVTSSTTKHLLQGRWRRCRRSWQLQSCRVPAESRVVQRRGSAAPAAGRQARAGGRTTACRGHPLPPNLHTT